MKLQKRDKLPVLIILIINIIWLLYILSPVLFTAPDYIKFNRLSFSHICHQIPERSFSFNNVNLPVCHRCFAIYSGAFIAALLWTIPFFRKEKYLKLYRRFFFTALILTGIEKFSDFFFDNPPAIRIAAGFILGLSVILMIEDLLILLINNLSTSIFREKKSDG